MVRRKASAPSGEKPIRADIVAVGVQRAGKLHDWLASAGELLADEDASLTDRRWALKAIGEAHEALTRGRIPRLSTRGRGRVYRTRFPDAPREVEVDQNGKPLAAPRLGLSSVVAVFQRLSDQWRDERRRSEASEHRNTIGTPAATAESDGDAIRELASAMVDALQGTTGWQSVRRAHAALTGADRDDPARRRAVLADVHWALAVLPPQRTSKQRAEIARMLLRGLASHHSKFANLSVRKTLEILQERRSNTRLALIAARLSVACGAFSHRDVNDSKELFRKDLAAMKRG